MIIGITGTIGAGKGEVSSYLQTKGFVHFSVRNFLTKEMEKRSLQTNRGRMTDLADELRKTHGPSYIIEQLYAEAVAGGANAVIESVRAKGEVDFLESKDAILMAVDADPKLRYDRIRLRKSALDGVSYEKFLADERREMDSDEANRGNIRDCMRRADFLFRNDGTRDELYAQIETALKQVEYIKN